MLYSWLAAATAGCTAAILCKRRVQLCAGSAALRTLVPEQACTSLSTEICNVFETCLPPQGSSGGRCSMHALHHGSIIAISGFVLCL